jgi:hypothetical protein
MPLSPGACTFEDDISYQIAGWPPHAREKPVLSVDAGHAAIPLPENSLNTPLPLQQKEQLSGSQCGHRAE